MTRSGRRGDVEGSPGWVWRSCGARFAAGALFVMLVDEMIPEAQHKAGSLAGLATVVGFALAAGCRN
ncbi:hypothetical protein [Janibacter cremeus]|uniref:Uncharacterized protein n=1 Tax=Janibacter cremeus TaxID=1285192 RepID=A0A852VJ73_9MICO|nr:hypothetical protein [Janibacter cremeus]NYF97157.1 hypothetical protein [Janibacter cremeus]